MERKCPKCNTWNKDEDYCISCETPLSQEIIRKEAVEKKEVEFLNKPKDKFDVLQERMKYSKFFLIRWTYYVIYSIWAAFVAVMSFFLYMVAAGPG